MRSVLENARGRVSGALGSKAARPVFLVVAGLIAAASYMPMRAQMLDQGTSYVAVTSNVTVNYVLALYGYGVLADRLSRKLGRKAGWILWGVGLIGIILALRYVFGWEMRW